MGLLLIGARRALLSNTFSPRDLFKNGEQGVWYSPQDLSTMFQDTAGTTPVTVPGGGSVDPPVGLIRDKSGRGNHATQATASARPKLSARINQLLATDVLSTQSVTVAAVSQILSFTGTGTITLSGVSTAGPLVGTGATDRVSLTFVPTAGSLTLTVSGSVTLAQLEIGSVATRYQSVTDASNYDTAFPLSEKFDGVDDGNATAAFAAGTLTSDMDFFFLLHMDAVANLAMGFTSDLAKFFGVAVLGSGTSASDGISGTPTYAINGVDVPGGTGTTRGQLFAAIPIGQWGVLEVRNLDLSAWTSFARGNYPTLPLNGRVGSTILCPAQSDARRAQIRRYLGRKVGLAL